MKKTSIIFIKLATLSVLFFSITAGSAHAISNYTVLEPLPGIAADQPQTFSNYLPAIFKLAIGVAGILAFVMITFGGIMYATSDSITGKSSGREYVKNALLGLLLVIGAYAILFTINPQFVSFSLSIQQIVQQNATSTATVSTPAPAGTTPVKVNGVLQGYVLTSDQINQDQQMRTDMAGATNGRVTVNNSACTTGGTVGCTNVVGLPQNAVTDLENLASPSQCNCFVTITGGTEGGHAEHGPGLAVVDLDPRSDLNAYLAKTNPAAANPVSGTTVTVGGATFTYEVTGDNGRATGNHWHVTLP